MEGSTVLFSVWSREADACPNPAGLAYAVHLSFRRAGGEWEELNRGGAVLYAPGYVSPEDTIVPVGVRHPRFLEMEDGAIGILADTVFEDGGAAVRDGCGAFLWTTRDLVRFEEAGWVRAEAYAALPATDTLALDTERAEAAIAYWSPVRMERLQAPAFVRAASREDMEAAGATAVYSDGTQRRLPVRWHLEGVDFSRPGVYEAEGDVLSPAFRFPLARGYGDPVVFSREGKWYFLGTNDNMGDIGLYIREADTPEGLFAPGIREHLILPYHRLDGFEQTFWAPEMHVIGGKVYILFAVSGHVWGPQCHVMELLEGGSLTRAEDWDRPRRVVRRDGSPLSSDGITLDMTFLRTQSGAYMVWSYRRHIGTPSDTGSMLYIASVSEEKPWVLTSEPVLLTRPLYGWENVAGTINNEGPNAFVHDGKVYLTYSGGSANAYTYALGLMTADGADCLLDPAAWHKSITPVLTWRSVPGEYGPGHNSFFTMEDGSFMIAYHAEGDIASSLRCDGIRRVHFRGDGTPDFQVSAEDDLPAAARKVRVRVAVG